ncbi:Protein transport protein yos1 [Leucoagaricus sp. SymC.cos]|nr:Protein transport protein yos1 [Leucoagaricus sp. SymC.cos]
MFGTMLQVSLLLVNAIAILNEERFLARIGWASPRGRQAQNPAVGYNQGYDQTGYGDQDVGVKARLVELINAVRTLMRIPLIVVNILVILYELLWG